MSKSTILVNLKRCTGCWTCSLACKQVNHLADDEFWQYVRTQGSGKGIDRPAGVWPDLSMSWLPIYTRKCTMCGQRTAQGAEPFCVYNCPNQALTFGDLDNPTSAVSQALEDLRQRNYQIFELPEWEGTRTGIIYANRT